MQNEPQVGALSLVPYTIECLEKSWVWLNDPEIRELTMTPYFTREEQQCFFQSLPERSGYDVWGVCLDGYGVVGAAGLKNQRDSVAEYWGYIGERQFWGAGLGRKLIAAVEAEARALGITALFLKVARTNERAIALYMKTGFTVDITESDENVLHMVKKNI